MEKENGERVQKLVPREDLYLHFQDIPLKNPPKGEEPLEQFIGPLPDESGVGSHPHFYGRTISTYPTNSITNQREGDPICDSFGFQAYPGGGAVLVVADGCNWGEKPREASERARDCFMRYMRARRHKLHSSREAGHYLLRAFNKAQEAIMCGKTIEDEAGTTTLLGGIVVPVDMQRLARLKKKSREKGKDAPILEPPKRGRRAKKDNTPEKQRWIFMCASVGDCRAFICNQSTRTLFDVSTVQKEANGKKEKGMSSPAPANKGEASPKKSNNDPGGRLGGYLNGLPDLRNLRVFVCELKENETVMLVSDGVYDNLDARHLGLLPQDIKGIQEYGDRWDMLPDDPKIKSLTWGWLRENFFNVVIKDKVEEGDKMLESLVETLLQHALDTTSSSREFMQQNPHKRLPKDYRTYQGKMDHTTCICYRIQSQFYELLEPLEPLESPSTSYLSLKPRKRTRYSGGTVEEETVVSHLDFSGSESDDEDFFTPTRSPSPLPISARDATESARNGGGAGGEGVGSGGGSQTLVVSNEEGKKLQGWRSGEMCVGDMAGGGREGNIFLSSSPRNQMNPSPPPPSPSQPPLTISNSDSSNFGSSSSASSFTLNSRSESAGNSFIQISTSSPQSPSSSPSSSSSSSSRESTSSLPSASASTSSLTSSLILFPEKGKKKEKKDRDRAKSERKEVGESDLSI
uniref:PPM-type phosphatase domain-containing protein n=1 Tax=Paramoeba aestuarina TaxID=180227 RepID=A0A7S4P4A0_9EUKA|mmetsp:Transcript_36053/g.56420  ORF Transcript_36053/g.56420 Transcript_36053/m.56420 type:complete len:689 (+) Transcript_36053:259-2325(+)